MYTSVSWCKLLQVSTLQEGLLRLEYADEASEDSFGRETLPMPPLRPQVLPIRKFEPPHEDTRRHRRWEWEGCGRQLMVFKSTWAYEYKILCRFYFYWKCAGLKCGKTIFDSISLKIFLVVCNYPLEFHFALLSGNDLMRRVCSRAPSACRHWRPSGHRSALCIIIKQQVISDEA